MDRLVQKEILLRAAGMRQPLLRPARPHTLVAARAGGARFASSHLPTIAQPSFWKSLVPKPLRPGPYVPPDVAALKRKPKSKEWNPATFYIVIFLFIGSMAIQMISLKKNFATFMRQSDVRIGLLREVVERIQKGEKVDVERVLGTGDAEREIDWEYVLKEIERDDATRHQKKQEKKQVEALSSRTSEPATSTEAPETAPKAKATIASFF